MHTQSPGEFSGGPSRTSLDPLESASHQAEVPEWESRAAYAPLAETFRHSGWAQQRERVRRALIASGQSWGRVEAFAACGIGAFVLRDAADPDRLKVVGSQCRDRFCQPCQRSRAGIIAANLADFLGSTPVRFITLTLKASNTRLDQQLRRLHACYSSLRRKALWNKHIRGAAAFTEVHLKDNGYWHPHLHVLAHGTYLPHNALRQAWRDVTGDSHIVDVRMARSHEEVVRYVAKYVGKGLSAKVTDDPARLAELIEAMKHVKLVRASGDWRKLNTTATHTEGEWEYFCTLEELVREAKNRRGWWLEQLRRLTPAEPEQLFECLAPPPRPPPPPVVQNALVCLFPSMTNMQRLGASAPPAAP